MIAEAIEKIKEMVKPEIHEINGNLYRGGDLLETRIRYMEPILLNTLTGLIDYIESDHDELISNGIIPMVIINSPINVSLVSKTDHKQNRHSIINVSPFKCEFSFNYKMDLEEFIIGIQANFQVTDDAKKILAYVSALKSSDVKKIEDNGCSQEIMIKSGIRSEVLDVPSPAILKPWRTFVEVEQPESDFVFRINKGSGDVPVCGLYDADGGAWKNEAIINIRDYLKKNLPKGMVIIA